MTAPAKIRTCGECKWWSKSDAHIAEDGETIVSYCAVDKVLCTEGDFTTHKDFSCPAHDDGSFEKAVHSLITDARVLATAAQAENDIEGREIAAITFADITAVEEALAALKEVVY